MKLHPATLLVLAMFGSFAIILTLMIALFRPEPKPATHRTAQVATRPPVRDTLRTAPPKPAAKAPTKASADTVTPPPETRTGTAASILPAPPVQPKTMPQSAEANRRLYHELEREQREMRQLRARMETRLKTALAEHDKKLAQLARRCEPLEPGEAVQVLSELSDDDIAGVLDHMQPDKVPPIIVLLKRLGRNKAVADMK